MNTRILTNPSYDTGLLCVICAHACGLHSRCCKPISVCLVCVVARDYGWVSVCILTMIEWSCPTFGSDRTAQMPEKITLRGGGWNRHVQKPYRVQDLPHSLASMRERLCYNLKTVGGGDCAVHAAFGDVGAGAVRCPRPRALIRGSFGETATEFETKVGNACLCEELKKTLWLNAYKECAKKELQRRRPDLHIHVNLEEIGEEGRILWSTLMELNPTLAEKCIDAVLEETVFYNEWELRRRPLVEAFASTCTSAPEHSFIHPLLKLSDLFDDYRPPDR